MAKRVTWQDGNWSCTNIDNGRAYLPSFMIEKDGKGWDILLDRSEERSPGLFSVVLSPSDSDGNPDEDIEVVCPDWTFTVVQARIAVLCKYIGVEAPSADALTRMYLECGWKREEVLNPSPTFL